MNLSRRLSELPFLELEVPYLEAEYHLTSSFTSDVPEA